MDVIYVGLQIVLLPKFTIKSAIDNKRMHVVRGMDYVPEIERGQRL